MRFRISCLGHAGFFDSTSLILSGLDFLLVILLFVNVQRMVELWYAGRCLRL